MANIWDGKIYIWEPLRKQYLKTTWQDGWIEFVPSKSCFDIYTVDDRCYLRQGRSTMSQKIYSIPCDAIKSVSTTYGNTFSFRFIQQEKYGIIFKKGCSERNKEVDVVYEVKFEGTTRECQRLGKRIQESCSVTNFDATTNPEKELSTLLDLQKAGISRPSTSDIKPDFKQEPCVKTESTLPSVKSEPLHDDPDQPSPSSSFIKIEPDKASTTAMKAPSNGLLALASYGSSSDEDEPEPEPEPSNSAKEGPEKTIKYAHCDSSEDEQEVELEEKDDGILKRFCALCNKDMPSHTWKEHVDGKEHRRKVYEQRQNEIKNSHIKFLNDVIEQVKNDKADFKEEEAYKEYLLGPTRFRRKREEEWQKMELFKLKERKHYATIVEEVDERAFKKPNKEWSCKYCDQKMPSKEAWEAHIKEHKGSESKKYKTGSEYPSSNYTAQFHRNPKFYAGFEFISKSDKAYCSFCKKHFDMTSELKEHEKTDYHLARLSKAVQDYKTKK